MKQASPLNILEGQTVHARFTPFEQRFKYRLLMVDVDIDALDKADRALKWFSVDRSNLFSINQKDHGERCEGGSLRGWAAGQLQRAGVDITDLHLRLITFPRHLFYRFSPLSIWFADDASGRTRGVIYEVNNTFGESHSYVAKVEGPRSVHSAEKRFHVSPFFDVSGAYRFTLNRTSKALSLVIDTLEGEKRTHMATISCQIRRGTDANLLRAAIARPLSSIGVTAGIHWEALKVWLRGARYRPKPEPPTHSPTLARPPAQGAPRTE